MITPTEKKTTKYRDLYHYDQSCVDDALNHRRTYPLALNQNYTNSSAPIVHLSDDTPSGSSAGDVVNGDVLYNMIYHLFFDPLKNNATKGMFVNHYYELVSILGNPYKIINPILIFGIGYDSLPGASSSNYPDVSAYLISTYFNILNSSPQLLFLDSIVPSLVANNQEDDRLRRNYSPSVFRRHDLSINRFEEKLFIVEPSPVDFPDDFGLNASNQSIGVVGHPLKIDLLTKKTDSVQSDPSLYFSFACLSSEALGCTRSIDTKGRPYYVATSPYKVSTNFDIANNRTLFVWADHNRENDPVNRRMFISSPATVPSHNGAPTVDGNLVIDGDESRYLINKPMLLKTPNGNEALLTRVSPGFSCSYNRAENICLIAYVSDLSLENTIRVSRFIYDPPNALEVGEPKVLTEQATASAIAMWYDGERFFIAFRSQLPGQPLRVLSSAYLDGDQSTWSSVQTDIADIPIVDGPSVTSQDPETDIRPLITVWTDSKTTILK